MRRYDYQDLIDFLNGCGIEDEDLQAMLRYARGPLMVALEEEIERRANKVLDGEEYQVYRLAHGEDGEVVFLPV